MRRKTALILACTLLVFVTALGASPARAEEPYPGENVTAGSMVFDAAIVRPLGIFSTLFGSAVYVVALPFTLPTGATIADLARLIHRDLPETMKFARLWGHGRFEGQQVHRTEVLCDRDVVEIHE